jgi:hypothetical protein
MKYEPPPIQCTSAGGIVLPYVPIPGFVEDQLPNTDYKLCEIKSVPDAKSETGRRKLYRYVIRDEAKIVPVAPGVKPPRKELRKRAALAERTARRKRQLFESLRRAERKEKQNANH